MLRRLSPSWEQATINIAATYFERHLYYRTSSFVSWAVLQNWRSLTACAPTLVHLFSGGLHGQTPQPHPSSIPSPAQEPTAHCQGESPAGIRAMAALCTASAPRRCHHSQETLHTGAPSKSPQLEACEVLHQHQGCQLHLGWLICLP